MASVLDPDVTLALAQDVARGMACDPKRIPSRYLYDALGSQLFEAICELPWYAVTRGERVLLARHADAILADLGAAPTVVELGAGNGEKLSLLLESCSKPVGPTTVHLVDISSTALELSARTLTRHSGVTVVLHEAPYEAGLKTVLGRMNGGGPVIVLFLGSNIGNMGPEESDRFLSAIRHGCRPGDRLLLGADLIKPEAILTLAYDDPLGVTAAFNKNLLVRLNRELDGDFDVRAFDHHVVWNPEASRVESYLVSRKEQLVCLRGAGLCTRLAEGESIWTESSYKYDPAGLVDMATRASFSVLDQWIESDSQFALTLLEAASVGSR
jgi:dimethylhistidine N-methyltransferase